jgi:hypothetical protein
MAARIHAAATSYAHLNQAGMPKQSLPNAATGFGQRMRFAQMRHS